MAKENSRERIIQLVFGSYPEAKQFHFTSDNQAFSEASDAKNHATTLEDKEVETIKRSDMKKSADKGAEDTSGNKDGKESKAASVDERAALVEEYEILTGKKAAHNIGIPKLKAAIEKAKAALKEQEPAEPIKKILTQDDLDANPDLVEQGLKVGDEVGIPVE